MRTAPLGGVPKRKYGRIPANAIATSERGPGRNPSKTRRAPLVRLVLCGQLMIESSSITPATNVGLPVVYCLPGSAAYCSGVRKGDIIVEVNGVSITDATAYLRACRLSSEDMQVKVQRGERFLDVTIPLKSDPRVKVNVGERFEC